MYFGWFAISDLYLFQEIALLNPCFIFSKNLIFSLVELMLIIIKFALVMLWCCVNTQSFVHNKLSSISQFINGKSRDLEKLLRYFSGIVTSTLKGGTGVSSDRSASPPSFPGRAGRCGVFPTIFVLYSNDLPSEALY